MKYRCCKCGRFAKYVEYQTRTDQGITWYHDEVSFLGTGIGRCKVCLARSEGGLV